MQTDLESIFPPLAPHLPPEGKPGLPHAAEPPISILRDTSNSKSESARLKQTRDFHLVRDLTLFARVDALAAQVTALQGEVLDLRAKLGLPTKTPDNSSTPPSKGQKPSQKPRRQGSARG